MPFGGEDHCVTDATKLSGSLASNSAPPSPSVSGPIRPNELDRLHAQPLSTPSPPRPEGAWGRGARRPRRRELRTRVTRLDLANELSLQSSIMRYPSLLLVALCTGCEASRTRLPAPRSVVCSHAAQRCAAPRAVATAFSLGTYMEEKRLITEAALEASLKSTCTQTDVIVESMRYSLMAGGKRVRPMLVFAATEMFGGSIEDATPTAVAIEMIHTMSLIHDDLPAMDDDDLRRGKPTNHVLYGDDVAILAGDAMLSESFAHVARNSKGIPADRVVKVLQIMGDSVGPLGLAGGQVMDLKSEGQPDVGMETLTWIHTHKTAALLKAAVACGAILAGASDEVRVSQLPQRTPRAPARLGLSRMVERLRTGGRQVRGVRPQDRPRFPGGRRHPRH